MNIPLETLKSTTYAALLRQGYNPDEAAVILEVLMYAQLRGNNQGVVKLTGAGMPKDPAATSITVERETPLSALLDGGRLHGMVVLNRAVDIALAKAREHGFGIVGTHATSTSTGAIGYFARRIAQGGMIGFVFSGSPEYVAMHGSYEAIFGTNPLAIAAPTTGEPVVFDMATAAIARYGIIEARIAGRALPEGVAYDAAGALTTDPAAALGGAIRAFGGYKGAALAMMVELLTRTLVATTPDANGRKTDSGNLAMAIDPGLLVDRQTFLAEAAALVEKVKATAKLPGVDEILVPGERGDRLLREAEAAGAVEVEDNLWADLQRAAGQTA